MARHAPTTSTHAATSFAGPQGGLAPGCACSRLRIDQMDCPTEEGLIRKRLASVPGVERLEFDLLRRVLTVEHLPGALPRVEAALREVGMTPSGSSDRTPAPSPSRWATFGPLVLAALAAAGAEGVHLAGGPEAATVVLALTAIGLTGLGTYRKGWIALRHGDPNINALMSIAVTGAFVIGAWAEAAAVMVLFTLAERIEAGSLARARRAIGDLLRLAPPRATVRRADGTWAEVDAASVVVDDVIRVRPGERVALDGQVVGGRSAVDQAPITGEGLPVEKVPGDVVFAGTVNASGSLEVRVTAAAADTTLARIVHAVEAAQGSRAPMQRFVDRFARVYTPAVLAVALLVAVVPPLVADAAWQVSIYQALVLLVIACPCALVISTPVTIVSGLATAARHGILVKGGAFLERGRDLAWLAFDKTGTITHGRPVQTDLYVVDDRPGADVVRIAASLAARSDHPVSRAVAGAAAAAGVGPAEVEGFEAQAGTGVRGVVGGVRYHLGARRGVPATVPMSADLAARLDGWERLGKTSLVLYDAGRVLAAFAVADTIRPASRAAVAELHELGIRTLMLSGDNRHAVRAIADQAGIDEALGELLPSDKGDAIGARRPSSRRGRWAVGMVGDGINDAPALASADIGFAMGAAGSDTAIETADVALMDDDLRKVARFVRLSRSTHRVLVQNLVLALGIKAAFVALTIAGVGTMWMAVFADMGASLLVVANGLRLLRWRGGSSMRIPSSRAYSVAKVTSNTTSTA